MTEDPYEKLRQIMDTFILKVPKHEKLTAFLKECFNEEEAKLLTHFKAPLFDSLSAKQLAKLAGKSEEEVTEIMERLAKRGTIIRQLIGKKKRVKYTLMTFFPGLYESFFISYKNHTPEQNLRAAEAYEEYYNSVYHKQVAPSKYPFNRILPTSTAVEKLKKEIEVNENIDAQQEILPFEVVSDFISSSEQILVTRCQCRLHQEISGGKKCNKPIEDTCMVLGLTVPFLVDMGYGRLVDKEEAIKILKDLEKKGFVHTTMNVEKGQDTLYICNCCPDCCVVLRELLQYQNPSTYTISNFTPIFEKDSCKKCGACVKICPADAIELKEGKNEDKSDATLIFSPEKCLGCGLCVTHCPNNNIKLQKVRNEVPASNIMDMFSKIEKTRFQ